MDLRTQQLIDELADQHSLALDGYAYVLAHYSPEAAAYAAERAVATRQAIYGTDVFIRGLIEVSNYCRNDCYYCGLRLSNASCDRYRLSRSDVLACARLGYELGFRTFVLQSGEDPHLTDEFVCDIIETVKGEFPDSAITLSLGERSHESYTALREAGADRYLLRHEAAAADLYASLHPARMSYDHRMACLNDLRQLGFAVGAGFMVSAPGQTTDHLATDLQFIEQFKPEMCGLGPFVPHHATPYANEPAGTLELTCYLLSL